MTWLTPDQARVEFERLKEMARKYGDNYVLHEHAMLGIQMLSKHMLRLRGTEWKTLDKEMEEEIKRMRAKW